MSRSILQIFGEAQAAFDAKEWAICRTALEELYALKYRQPLTAIYLGEVCFCDGDLDGAVKWNRLALDLNANLPEAIEHLIFVKDCQPETTAAEALALREEWWRRFGRQWWKQRQQHRNNRDPERVLRVGYVSGDFRFHSACTAFATVVSGHTYEIDPYFYSTLDPNKYDSLTHLWRKDYPHSWRDVSAWSLPKLIQQVRNDAIDILVDLSGFTAGNRLLAFAAHPAPIQIQAFGYVLGTGSPAIDVVFADRIVGSPEVQLGLRERLAYLPTLLSYFPRPDLPAATSLPCLSQPPVFGVFNRAIKINSETLNAWLRILDRVPGSMIRFQGFDYSDAIQMKITAVLGAARCWFTQSNTDRGSKIAYEGIDVCLDPWPQTGGVSTLDALFMHVPVVTLIGPRMIQRTSASFLTAVGLHGFITETVDEYVDAAVHWVTDGKQELAQIRKGLRARFRDSPIVNGYVEAVESAYRSLWREFCVNGTLNPLY